MKKEFFVKLQKCRIILRVQFVAFASAILSAAINVSINNSEGHLSEFFVIICYFCIAIASLLCIPISKMAVCIRCGKSLLLSYIDSRKNCLPLFQILVGRNPLCKECAQTGHNRSITESRTNLCGNCDDDPSLK